MAEVICKRIDCVHFSNKFLPSWADDLGECTKGFIKVTNEGCSSFKQKENKIEEGDENK